MDHVVFDRDKVERLVVAYHEAVKSGKLSFKFEGNEYLTAYSKYLLEDLSPQFGVEFDGKPSNSVQGS